MLPRELQTENFVGYPPQANRLVAAHLAVLRELPLSFLPSLLQEVIEYDLDFPLERAAIDKDLDHLSALTSPQIQEWFRDFAQIKISSKLEHSDWVNQPAQFVEQLSAHLWTTHQTDAFRNAAIDYQTRLNEIAPVKAPEVRRVGIAVIGHGVTSYDGALFRNLRPHGTYFSHVKSDNGVNVLLTGMAERAQQHSATYAHWYVDGGQAFDHSPLLTTVSYQSLEPARAALLKKIQAQVVQPGMGPEQLRDNLARMKPADVGVDVPGDPVMRRFQLKVLTEGSGTQIFSTSFAQWTTREALRRAQPLTMLVRFAPRQRQRPMNEMWLGESHSVELDLRGSLIDGDMAAYYHWINQQRLPGYEHSSFLAWYEDHGEAIAIGPSFARGTQSDSEIDIQKLFSLVVS